ncbi:hypothetical protein B7494_g1196 [Chlorociboria aeruginascens]|nr:hypothetical protein B7494_g1196 [Chlorociboria aeruginascens]
MKLLIPSTLLLLFNWISAAQLDAQQPIVPDSSSSTTSLLGLHKSLVEHESITGNESHVAQFLISYLHKRNFTTEIQEVEPATPSSGPRSNVLAYIGKQRKTRTLVSSHIDTVPPFWPYERRGDEIWGRGSVDAKGSVATQIIAVEDLIRAGKIKEGDLALLFVVGEEVSGVGMKKANDLGLKWDTVIFGEPTELKLASGHKGVMRVEIKAKGKAGHSGYPELGKNAISMLIPALYALQNVGLPWSTKFGNTTLNIGRIGGGVASNVIAEEAQADLALRIADGDPADVQKIILDTVQEVGEELDVTFTKGYGPVSIDSDVPGFETIVVNYGTDIPYLQGDHKKYLYGPGTILLAHSDHEHIKVSDLVTAVKGYKILIEHSLRAAHRASSAVSSYNAAKTTDVDFQAVATLLGSAAAGTRSLVALQNTLASSILAQQTPAASFFDSDAGPYLLALSRSDHSVSSSAYYMAKMRRQQTQTPTTATSATHTNAATTTATGAQSTGAGTETATPTTSGSASTCNNNVWATVTNWISQSDCTKTSASSPELGGSAAPYAALAAFALGVIMLL